MGMFKLFHSVCMYLADPVEVCSKLLVRVWAAVKSEHMYRVRWWPAFDSKAVLLLLLLILPLFLLLLLHCI